MSLENSKWWTIIHETEKHEVGGDWEGRGLLWPDLEVVHGLRILTTDNLLTIMFKVGLQSYLKIATTWMKWSTL